LVFEKGLLPKNQLYAEKGEGWADSTIKCLFVSIRFFLLLAKFHQSINTTQEVFCEIDFIILSLKVSQPIFEW